MSALLSLLISLSWSKHPVTGLLLCLAEPRFLFSSSCSLLIGIRKRLAYPVASTSPEEDGLYRVNVAQHSQYAVHHNLVGRINTWLQNCHQGMAPIFSITKSFCVWEREWWWVSHQSYRVLSLVKQNQNRYIHVTLRISSTAKELSDLQKTACAE